MIETYVNNDPMNAVDPFGQKPEHIQDKVNEALRKASVEVEQQIQDAHYGRNENNEVPATQTEAEAVDKTGQAKFEQMSDTKSVFHRQGEGGEGNSKFVSQDGKHEAVYDTDGNLVTDDVNQGTYNFASPNDNPLGHFVLDVIPYYIYGNSPNDPTTFKERLTASYKGDVNAKKR